MTESNPQLRSDLSWMAWGFMRGVKNIMINRFFWTFVLMQVGLAAGMSAALHTAPNVVNLLWTVGGLAITGFLFAAMQALQIDLKMQKLIDKRQREDKPAELQTAKTNYDMMHTALGMKRRRLVSDRNMVIATVLMFSIGFAVQTAALKGISWPGPTVTLLVWAIMFLWPIYENRKVFPIAKEVVETPEKSEHDSLDFVAAKGPIHIVQTGSEISLEQDDQPSTVKPTGAGSLEANPGGTPNAETHPNRGHGPDAQSSGQPPQPGA